MGTHMIKVESKEDWSGIALPTGPSTPAVRIINSPDPAYHKAVRDLSRQFELYLEIRPWLKASEETFRRFGV